MAADNQDVMPFQGEDGGYNPAAGLIKTQTPYATAVVVAIPRTLARVEHNVCVEATKLGEKAFYSWATKGKKSGRVTGPSVKLANCLARLWGNSAIDLQPVQDAGDAWIFSAAFVDLETGFTMPRQYRMSKTFYVHGQERMDSERVADIRFQIGMSKAIRNVVLQVIPPDIVSRAMAAAQGGAREKINAFIKEHGIEKATDLILKGLKKNGVEEAAVLARFDISKKEALHDVDRLITLRADLSAIDDGESSAPELFPQAAPKSNTDLRGEMSKKPDAKPASEPPPDDGKASENEIQCSELKAEWAELATGFETKRAVAILKDHGIKGILSLKECTDPEKLAAAVEALKGVVLARAAAE